MLDALFSKSSLRVTSALCTNLATVWLVGAFATSNLVSLTRVIAAAIFALLVAVKAEKIATTVP